MRHNIGGRAGAAAAHTLGAPPGRRRRRSGTGAAGRAQPTGASQPCKASNVQRCECSPDVRRKHGLRTSHEVVRGNACGQIWACAHWIAQFSGRSPTFTDFLLSPSLPRLFSAFSYVSLHFPDTTFPTFPTSSTLPRLAPDSSPTFLDLPQHRISEKGRTMPKKSSKVYFVLYSAICQSSHPRWVVCLSSNVSAVVGRESITACASRDAQSAILACARRVGSLVQPRMCQP